MRGTGWVRRGTDVLIVDDNADCREMLSEFLSSKGLRICQSDSAVNGIAQAHVELPSVVLLDIKMLPLSGWEVFRILRKDPRTARTPVIITSAAVMDGEADDARRAGCFSFFAKPLDLEGLHAAVRQAIGGPILTSAQPTRSTDWWNKRDVAAV
jgi:CheY-like chemotaxis protein